MPDNSRILIVVDPTMVAQPTIQRGIRTAKAIGASIRLLICFHDEYLTGDRLIEGTSLDSARENAVSLHQQALDELAAPIRREGIDVTTRVVWDRPLSEGIVREAIRLDADFVIKDTHHHAALQRALFSNTDWDLIRDCPVPLWLVRPPGDRNVDTVLAAIDPLHQHDKPAALDDRILKIAASLASAMSAQLHVFHSFDPRTAQATAIGNAYIPASLPYLEIENTIRTLHEKRVGDVAGFHGIPESHQHVLPGLAHKELPKFAASLPAQLVVMGAVARSAIKRLFIGATAEQTLEHLPCDLLVVKPEWFESPVDQDESSRSVPHPVQSPSAT